MRMMVTGASGFLGKFVVKQLAEKGYEVHAVSSNPDYMHSEAKVHHANLLDKEQAERMMNSVRPTHFIHLAWETKHSVYAMSNENLDWLSGSLNIVRCFAENGGQRFVSAGTCNEYDLSSGVLYEERSPVEKRQLYGVTKRSFYNTAQSFLKSAGVSYACGRIFFLYGENDKPTRAVPYAIKNFLEGKQVTCNAADAIRDYMHVEDGAKAFVELLESSMTGAVNIASGIPVTMGEIFSKIAGLTCRRELLTLNKMSGGDPIILADTTRMKSELEFIPEITLIQGLERTVEHYKDGLHGALI